MRKLFLIFSLICLFSCAEEKKKIPAGLLSPATLTSMLADIHTAEARVEAMRLNPDSSKAVFDKLQGEVFKKYQVTEVKFNKTYNYYLENIRDLDRIYEGLVDTLSIREAKLSAQNSNKPQADTAGTSATDTTTAKKSATDTIIPTGTRRPHSVILDSIKKSRLNKLR